MNPTEKRGFLDPLDNVGFMSRVPDGSRVLQKLLASPRWINRRAKIRYCRCFSSGSLENGERLVGAVPYLDILMFGLGNGLC
jgi:hypothetical protein